jgi:hypothetical protein
MWTAFDYMYRDAGNFKALGTVVVDGHLEPEEKQLIREGLSSGEFFIAEQVGLPPLYRQLYQYSDGPTKDDHCWHEFIEFRELPEPPNEPVAMTAAELVKRFAHVVDWNEGLSRHFWLDGRL